MRKNKKKPHQNPHNMKLLRSTHNIVRITLFALFVTLFALLLTCGG